jgi:hypothetical protein
MSATELCSGAVESESREQGRRLLLKFIGKKNPELDRVEFQWNKESECFYWQQGDPPEKNPMSWTPVPQALALVFLDYLGNFSLTAVGPTFFTESNSGGLCVSLGNAISDLDGKLHELFAEKLPKGKRVSRVKQVFSGKNVHGREKGERRIFVRCDNMPPDCIEVYAESCGPGRITDQSVIRGLARQVRMSLGVPVEPELPAGEGIVPKTPEAVPSASKDQQKTPEQKTPAEPSPQTADPIAAVAEKFGSSLLSSIELVLSRQNKGTSSEKQTKPGSQSESPLPPEPEPVYVPPPIPRIPRGLFAIRNPDGLTWEDSHELLDFGEDDSGDDIWRLKDACEGVLILGAPGSGKTSGSGFAFASAFLAAGFGGLVLAAKPEEARRWQSLCVRLGRAQDCLVVTPDGPHKLNPLTYETQRPGSEFGLTDELIAFFRVLIGVVSRRTAGQNREDFWTNATNQLMRELFDVFLLAGEPLSIDSLTRFLTKAPAEPTKQWREIPFFGEILLRAEKVAHSPADLRICSRVRDYWTVDYPRIAHQTRSGIVLGFTAMANALSGRGIHELISTETTVTPEMILSGKIVVLNLPLKQCGQGGLLIQAAWKYLFQRAVERRADKGMTTARPVFLWEDEGHLFFSQHDIEFQPTARDCRAAHVILSQSLHNFYQLGHNPHAVEGVFATMNTQVFHANGDMDTNKWASDKLGTTIKTLVNVSVSSVPKTPTQPRHWFFDVLKQEERTSTSSTSVNQHREKVLQPEEFARLKKGGDGTCQAVLLWVSHAFRCSGGRPFRVVVFGQDDDGRQETL